MCTDGILVAFHRICSYDKYYISNIYDTLFKFKPSVWQRVYNYESFLNNFISSLFNESLL